MHDKTHDLCMETNPREIKHFRTGGRGTDRGGGGGGEGGRERGLSDFELLEVY